MKKIKIKFTILICALFFINILVSQTVEINGLINAKADIEGIHVINKTSQKFTTTNKQGGFKIYAKLNDTIVFSSIQYKLEALKISEEIIETKTLVVYLTQNVIELDEVVVGKVLTGDLLFDINNTDAKRPIDFYDVGIPGYTGKPKTQSERRVYEADAGKFVSVLDGSLVNINFYKILNRITGRTKMLKLRVKLETEEKLMYSIKVRLSEDFFSAYPLEKTLQLEFFYFCSEDENFNERCKGKSDIEVFEYLKEKYLDYKKNLETKED
ncbi:MAG: hypothetical protein IIC74_04185 [Bacteroidetes bacterium]|nr:hypothetical protein [Bacteroidota bacterium]